MIKLIEMLLPILAIIESGNDCNAIGDEGQSIGILQIKQITVDDANRINELRKDARRYTYQDRFDKDKSFEICRIILTEYGNKLPKEEQTMINLGQIWNRGFASYRQGARNEDYSIKIRAILASKSPISLQNS